MFAVPILMDEYSNNIVLGALLTFLTVTCLAGMHEVARELENPFRNVPNEIPLRKLQAFFNESLITLYSGFHPDHYWDPDEYRNPELLKSVGTNDTIDTSDEDSKEKNKKKNEPQLTQEDKPLSLRQLQAVVSE